MKVLVQALSNDKRNVGSSDVSSFDILSDYALVIWLEAPLPIVRIPWRLVPISKVRLKKASTLLLFEVLKLDPHEADKELCRDPFLVVGTSL